MRHTGLLLLVTASVCLSAAASAATRPQYGGTLRVALQDAPVSLDPADASRADSPAMRSVSHLIFETLVTLDERGQPTPGLASSWRSEPGSRRWQFSIRSGVTFQDGTSVSPDSVAASLRNGNPNWKVFSAGEEVVIECDAATANLPAILAQARYGIARRTGGQLSGSGPFSVSSWEPGKKLVLKAREDYWGGRAFLDTIEIDMGKNFREQMMLLDLGKADVVEIAPEQARRAASGGRRVENSQPVELMALNFTRARQGLEDGKLRQALSLSIDRQSMKNVLLQGEGEPTASLLPDWMSGYAFLFPTAADMQRAQLTRGEVPQAPLWTLTYDVSDPLAAVIAERIALNASEAGLRLQVAKSDTADIQMVRIPLTSLDARLALGHLAAKLELPHPAFTDDSVHTLYLAESALLQTQRVIPLLYLRNAVGLSSEVWGWMEDQDGSWQLQNVWLRTEKP